VNISEDRIYGTHIYFDFFGRSESGKTMIWEVITNDGNTRLGIVSWFGRWRKYAFYPNGGTVFEEKCLREIAEVCETITKLHRKKK
jgi:hypothetical protein